jgi:hypothetical protein
MHHAHDPAWIIVHFVGHGACGGTHAALHAFVDVLPAQFFNLLDELTLLFIWQCFGGHVFSRFFAACSDANTRSHAEK